MQSNDLQAIGPPSGYWDTGFSPESTKIRFTSTKGALPVDARGNKVNRQWFKSKAEALENAVARTTERLQTYEKEVKEHGKNLARLQRELANVTKKTKASKRR